MVIQLPLPFDPNDWRTLNREIERMNAADWRVLRRQIERMCYGDALLCGGSGPTTGGARMSYARGLQRCTTR